MKRRIFIAINLPENIKKKLADFQDKWPELPARWTKQENIHITLVFIGYVKDEEIPEICKVVKQVASKNKPFLINLTKVIYGPPKKMPPRMVWAEGEKSKELANLKTNLENSLINSKNVGYQKAEARAFSPHITLARIRSLEWRQIEPEERPEIKEDISLNFEVESIEVMESQLKRGGAEYMVLESAPLADSKMSNF